ncbi:C-type lectin lectoxin-Enh6-like [Daphnia carinata]|uniref:C-type lectin lectoxin-Enh6-like n=1 Tax=Daphnia carinata TaxID=120202 RepID=UPI00257F83BA|nr:C-type lectin lectoxin-Enh6-like [Daphnia carinata]
MKIIALCIFALVSISSSYGNVASTRNCGGRVFVQENVLIDVSQQLDCAWEFQTEENRILAITIVAGNVNDAQQFFTIHDGVDTDSPIVLQRDLPRVVYTTQPAASVQFKTAAPISNLKLKIQKAVICPANLGPNTSCGRIVDDISCYCVDYNLRNHEDQTTSCLNNGMKLLALESRTEENLLLDAWGYAARYWTSLTDNLNEGNWLWGSTGTGIVGGYFNWAINQPDGSGNCVHLNDASIQGGWNDDNCANLREAICESQP